MTWNRTPGGQTPPAVEISALEYLLVGDLRELLLDPPGKQQRHAISLVLDRLLALQALRFEPDEEEDDYLSDVTLEFPQWHDQVESLRADHWMLYDELRELRRDLNHELLFRRASFRMRRRLAVWVHRLTEHERQERELLQIACNLDVGSGD